MREINTHKVNGCNENLQVIVGDEPGRGGANHSYQIINTSRQNTAPDADECLVQLDFQNGPIAEAGVNGITHQALLAVLIDRLQGFQSGPYAHPYNGDALKYLRCALASLQQRTRDRLARGVEGTLTV